MAFQKQPVHEIPIASGNLGALNDTVIMQLGNDSGAIVNVSGTWSGTIVFEGTNDEFVTVQNAAVFTPVAGVITGGVAANGYYRFVAISGFTKIRARMSAYTSGSATIIMTSSMGSGLAPTVSVNYNSMLSKSKIVGGDGLLEADVILKNGKHALLTDATVSVEQIFGFDDFADTWFQILNAGSLNDTWRVQIDAGAADTTTPLNNPPAVDVTVTVTASEVGNEINLRDKIIAALNADANFLNHWKASAVKDNTLVHISSKYLGEFGERTGPTAFTVTPTGTGSMTYLNADNRQIKRRGKQNSGIRDPRDKRLVTVGISGEVVAVPGAVGDLFIENALNGSASPDLRVNGSLTPNATNTFTIPADATKDTFIESLRFYGNGNGIKFGQFLSLNGNLTNGILVEIRSEGVTTQLPLIKSTDDLKHKFSFPAGSFELHVQAGRDDFMATFTFPTTFPIRKAGTIITGDDYIKVFIRDNLVSLQIFEFLAKGFQKEV